MKSTSVVIFLIIFFQTILISGCLDDPPALPVRDNPWDSLNPYPPRAPNRLKARALSETEMMVDWQDRSGNEDGFRVYESIGTEAGYHLIGDVEADTDTLITGHKPAGVDTLKYKVEAYNQYGASILVGAVFASTLKAPPLPPTELSIQLLNDSTIRLDWVDNSVVEHYFEIERSVNNIINFRLIDTVEADSTTIDLFYENDGSTYYFRVRAGNPYGFSAFTQPQSLP